MIVGVKCAARYSGDTGVDTGSRSVVSTAYAYGDYYRWLHHHPTQHMECQVSQVIWLAVFTNKLHIN